MDDGPFHLNRLVRLAENYGAKNVDGTAFQTFSRHEARAIVRHIDALRAQQEAARSLLLSWETAETGEECVCSKCGEQVRVPLDYEWTDGDWCHACWQQFGHDARAILCDLANANVSALNKHKGGSNA